MNTTTHWLPLLIGTMIVGCSSISESASPVNTSDLNECDFVRQIMANDSGAKGNYEVIPGSSVTTVRIFRPSKPVDEAALRQSMVKIKNAMRENFNREPNKLRFVFQEVAIEE